MGEGLHILIETGSAGAMKKSNALEWHKKFKWCQKDVKADERIGHPTTYGLTDMIKCMSDGSDTDQTNCREEWNEESDSRNSVINFVF